MTETLFQLLGWTGQALFFARFFIQWIASERAGRPVVPPLFWRLSFFACFFVFAYALHVGNVLFAVAPAVNAFIYARNIRLHGGGPALGLRALIVAATSIFLVSGVVLADDLRLDDTLPWIIVGVAGQLLWTIRFPLQWLSAERTSEATLPTSFFVVSFVGSLLLLAYAIHWRDPIFIAGMTLGPFVYGRNLWLTRQVSRCENSE